MSAVSRRYLFGPYILDPARGILLRHGVRVPLTPRMVDLLAIFVAQPGELFDKDQLIKRVWAGTVVEENNLARQVSSLRKALGETAGSREYIATVPGVGYRFVAPVTVFDESAVAEPSPAPVPGWWRQPVFASIAVLVVVTTVAAIVLDFRARNASDVPSTSRSMSQFTFGGGLQQDPAWSPDGRRLAFASDRQGTMDLWVQTIGAQEPTRLTTSAAREWQPSWSPDGREIAFRSDDAGGGLFVVPAAGGMPRKISDFGDRPQWSPNGDLILFSNAMVRTGARRLFVVSPAGGAAREIASAVVAPLIASGWATSVDATWYPDGKRVSIWGRADGRWTLVTAAVASGFSTSSEIPDAILRTIDESRLRLGRFVWARSARFLYFEGQSGDTRNLWRVSVDPSTLAWTGAPERLTVDIGDESEVALSGDGTRLAFTVRSQRTRVWSLGFNPAIGRIVGRQDPLTASSSGQFDVDTSADGSRLAYRSVRGGRSEMRELSTGDGVDRVLLVSTEWSPSTPRWSSDGRRIAFARPDSASRPTRNVVAVLSSPDSGEQRLTLPNDVVFRPWDWSADGTTILGDCREAPGESMGICATPAPGRASEAARLHLLLRDRTKHLFGPRFSPDQRWISFVAIDVKGSTTSRVYVAPVSGGAWVPVSDGRSFDDKPRWAPDGRSIYFVSDRDGYLNVVGRRFDPAAGVPVGDTFPVTSFNNSRRGLPSNIAQAEFAVARHRLFLPLTETEADIWTLDHVDR